MSLSNSDLVLCGMKIHQVEIMLEILQKMKIPQEIDLNPPVFLHICEFFNKILTKTAQIRTIQSLTIFISYKYFHCGVFGGIFAIIFYFLKYDKNFYKLSSRYFSPLRKDQRRLTSFYWRTGFFWNSYCPLEIFKKFLKHWTLNRNFKKFLWN